MTWIEALVLGVVQGLTEFLPISSDGHLNLTQHAFGAATGQAESESAKIFFDVMLHVGTLVAILVYYRGVIRDGARGLLQDAADVPPLARRPMVIRLVILAFVATLPLVLDKLFFIDWIEQAFHSLTATGVGFLITAAVLLLNTRLKGGTKEPATTRWTDALLVGLAQMFAPLPGVSRSGLTIASALALGFSRTWAVGFSLLIVVPAILGASAFEVLKLIKHPTGLSSEGVAQIVVAAAVAGVIGYFAIAWLVRLVQTGRLWYFSVYLLVLGLVVIAVDQRGKGGPDARPSHALDRTLRSGPASPGDQAGGARRVGRLAGADAPGPRPDSPGAGDRGQWLGDEPPRLDLDRRLAVGRRGSR